MAKFKIGDWVEITPNPDTSWSEWSTNHDSFCGAIGYIGEIRDSFSQFEDNDKIKIIVDFREDVFGGGYNRYFLWFLKRHVILSNKTSEETKQNLRKRGSELQRWEATKRSVVDKSLKKVFSPQKKKKVPEKVDIWDEKTDPMISIPKRTNDKTFDLFDDGIDIDDWLNDTFGP